MKTRILIKGRKSYLGLLLISLGMAKLKSISMVVRTSTFVKCSQNLQFLVTIKLRFW